MNLKGMGRKRDNQGIISELACRDCGKLQYSIKITDIRAGIRTLSLPNMSLLSHQFEPVCEFHGSEASTLEPTCRRS
jgi:hypothetical protein